MRLSGEQRARSTLIESRHLIADCSCYAVGMEKQESGRSGMTPLGNVCTSHLATRHHSKIRLVKQGNSFKDGNAVRNINTREDGMHDEYLSRLKAAIEDEPRILAGWLEGSLGRGNADRYSDIDLHLLLRDDGLKSLSAEAEQWLATIRPLVLFSLMFDGKMINALTVDGLRVDIWLHAAEVPTVDPAHAQVFYDPDQRIRSEPKEQMVNTTDLLPRIREFWRCISLTPAVAGRQELIVGLFGLGIEVNLLADILLSGYGIVRNRGVKNLNGFLTADVRQEIEQAISMQGLSQESLVRAHLALAGVAQTHGRIIAARHHFEYPVELERAVLDYVHKELALLAINVEPHHLASRRRPLSSTTRPVT